MEKIFKLVLLMLQLSFSLAGGSDDRPGASTYYFAPLCFCRWVKIEELKEAAYEIS